MIYLGQKDLQTEERGRGSDHKAGCFVTCQSASIMYAVAEVDQVVTGRAIPSAITEQCSWGGETNRFGASGPGLKIGSLLISPKVAPVCPCAYCVCCALQGCLTLEARVEDGLVPLQQPQHSDVS